MSSFVPIVIYDELSFLNTILAYGAGVEPGTYVLVVQCTKHYTMYPLQGWFWTRMLNCEKFRWRHGDENNSHDPMAYFSFRMR